MNQAAVILLVEDNTYIMRINREALTMEGYSVVEAENGSECIKMLGQHRIDLIILDVMLPDTDGISLCREIRRYSEVPILFLSALGENSDIIAGLEAGGDDYLQKPYDIQVLIARVQARLRTRKLPSLEHKHEFALGNLRLDTVSMIAKVGNVDLLLTQKEFSLLLVLVQSYPRAVEKETLYKNAWGTPPIEYNSALYTAVSRLNKKLSRGNAEFTITYHRNDGYLLT